MSIVDGLAAEALADFGEDFGDGVLTVPGTRTSDGQGGWIDGSPTPHPCRALLTDYSDFRRQALGIPATDRQVLVLGASLPAGVIPGAGHKVTVADPAFGLTLRTFDIVGRSGDPAGALYKLQVR